MRKGQFTVQQIAMSVAERHAFYEPFRSARCG
jgi:hypothetical protein